MLHNIAPNASHLGVNDLSSCRNIMFPRSLYFSFDSNSLWISVEDMLKNLLKIIYFFFNYYFFCVLFYDEKNIIKERLINFPK